MNAGITRLLGDHFAGRVINVTVSVVLGALIFYAGAWLLRVEELHDATNALLRRFRRRK